MKLIDTSFWVALMLKKDRHHQDAQRLWQQDPGPILCTNHVTGETWTFLRRRAGHVSAVHFLEAVEASNRVIPFHVPEAIEEEARHWLRRHDEREFSFVDAVSFAVMRNQHLNEALAFDGDFTSAGFIEIRP